MSAKAYAKREVWKRFCRKQVVENDLINLPNGQCGRGDGQNSMGRDMRGGYRQGRRKK